MGRTVMAVVIAGVGTGGDSSSRTSSSTSRCSSRSGIKVRGGVGKKENNRNRSVQSSTWEGPSNIDILGTPERPKRDPQFLETPTWEGAAASL